ncbi:hypothetical protein ONZ45_g14582 [Pleurotus djamor]|nr:hypothetical protein ONZ45_g14582 [Pleurotus djamor]
MVVATSQYRLPDLLSLFPHSKTCPQSSNISNPYFYELDTSFNDWLASLDIDPRTRITLDKIQMPVLICYAYPDATLFQLKACLNYLILAFIFEEITYVCLVTFVMPSPLELNGPTLLSDTTTADQSQRWADIYIDMYRGDSSKHDGCPEAEHPLFPVMERLADSVMTSLTSAYHEDFIYENLLSVRGIVQEAIDRDSPTLQKKKTLKSYYENRHATVGLVPFLILAQWVHEMNLPTDDMSQHAIGEMSKATVEMVFLANDIYSFKKEKLANDTQNNVITVIMNDDSTGVSSKDLQASFKYSNYLFREAFLRLCQYDKVLHKNTSISAEQRPSVERYKQAMMDCIRRDSGEVEIMA